MTKKRQRAMHPSQEAYDRGTAEQDYRQSRARAWRRHDAGQAVEVCFRCGTETDVPAAAHSFFCDKGKARGVHGGRRPVGPAGGSDPAETGS